MPAGSLAGSARPLKVKTATPEPARAIIVKAKGKPVFMGVLRFRARMFRETGSGIRAIMSVCTTEE
jgi:hypothetical protein